MERTTKKDLPGNETVVARLKNSYQTRKLATLAILAALAAILMFLEIPLPFMPEFLKYDMSEIPVLIGAFAYGPFSAIMIELVKNFVHLPMSTTGGIGQLANFLAGAFFAGTAGVVYQYMRSKKGAVIAMLAGTAALTVFTSLFNYYVLLDLYATVLGFPLEAILKITSKVNGLVRDKETLILFAFVPFNLFKGISVSIVTFIVYKPISTLINRLHCARPAVKEDADVDVSRRKLTEISAPKKATWLLALHIGIIGVLAQFVEVSSLDIKPYAIWTILGALVILLLGCVIKPTK